MLQRSDRFIHCILRIVNTKIIESIIQFISAPNDLVFLERVRVNREKTWKNILYSKLIQIQSLCYRCNKMMFPTTNSLIVLSFWAHESSSCIASYGSTTVLQISVLDVCDVSFAEWPTDWARRVIPRSVTVLQCHDCTAVFLSLNFHSYWIEEAVLLGVCVCGIIEPESNLPWERFLMAPNISVLSFYLLYFFSVHARCSDQCYY